jgi:hypothetical protein
MNRWRETRGGPYVEIVRRIERVFSAFLKDRPAAGYCQFCEVLGGTRLTMNIANVGGGVDAPEALGRRIFDGQLSTLIK